MNFLDSLQTCKGFHRKAKRWSPPTDISVQEYSRPAALRVITNATKEDGLKADSSFVETPRVMSEEFSKFPSEKGLD